MLKQDNQTSPSTQIHRELKDSCTPMTASNIKENVDTLYDGYNIAGKWLESHWPSLDQLED